MSDAVHGHPVPGEPGAHGDIHPTTQAAYALPADDDVTAGAHCAEVSRGGLLLAAAHERHCLGRAGVIGTHAGDAERQGLADLEGLGVRYVGFTIPNDFVIGYGLDVAERYRNLRYLAVYDPDADGDAS